MFNDYNPFHIVVIISGHVRIVAVVRCRGPGVVFCVNKSAAGWCFSGVGLGTAPTPSTRPALCTAAGDSGGSGGTAPGLVEGEWRPASDSATTRSKSCTVGSSFSAANICTSLYLFSCG